MQERPSAIGQNNDRMDYSYLLNDDVVNSKPLSAVGLGEHRMPPIIDLLSYISAADLSQQTVRKLSSSIQDWTDSKYSLNKHLGYDQIASEKLVVNFN